MKTAGYCLYCFHQELDASHRCAACGRVSLPTDRAKYWNRHPRFVGTEQFWKLASVIVGVFGGLTIFMIGYPSSGPGSGWLMLIPASFSVAGWKTAETCTKHLPYFNASLVWRSTFVILGGVSGLFVALSGSRTAAGFGWAAVFVTTGVGTAFVVGELFERWEQRKRDLMKGRRQLRPRRD